MFINVLKYGGVPGGSYPTALKINSRYVVLVRQDQVFVKIIFQDDSVMTLQHSNEDDARRLMGLFE
jgi:hypothetical protein